MESLVSVNGGGHEQKLRKLRNHISELPSPFEPEIPKPTPLSFIHLRSPRQHKHFRFFLFNREHVQELSFLFSFSFQLGLQQLHLIFKNRAHHTRTFCKEGHLRALVSIHRLSVYFCPIEFRDQFPRKIPKILARCLNAST